MTTDTIKTKIKAFYSALNDPATKDVANLLTEALAADWTSHGSESDPGKTREQFIAQVQGFGKAFTALSWEVVEVIPATAGDKVVIRSTVTGTPAGEFRGVPHTGKSFTIMAIDVHTVRDGELVRAHHVEDWSSALAQLSA